MMNTMGKLGNARRAPGGNCAVGRGGENSVG